MTREIHAGPFRKQDLDRLYEGALEVLARTGIVVEHAEARQVMREHPGVTVTGEKVTLTAELVRKTVPVPYGPGRAAAAGPLKLGIGGYCLKMRDLNTGKIRAPKLADLVDALKLADSYDAEGAVPLTPADLPPKLQELAMYRYGWEYTHNVFGEVLTHIDTAEAAFEMTRAMGRTFRHFVYVRSPLRIDAHNLEMLRRFAPLGAEVWCCTMGIMGMTAPLRLPGAFVQSLAELMGMITVAKLFVPEASILGAEVFLTSTDMKSGNFSFARPESVLVNMGAIQVMDYFGFNMRREAWLHTSAKDSGFQSAVEKAGRLGLLSPMGIAMASNLGMLGNDECFSFEQFVLDAELVRYMDAIRAGVNFSEDALELDAIAETMASGNYLTHDSTLDHWATLFQSPLFDYQSMETWRAAGGKSIVESAREIARERIARHTYRLDAARLERIEAIYRKMAATLGA